MKNNCDDCIHFEVCTYAMPGLPSCNSFLSEDIINKLNLICNVYAIPLWKLEQLKNAGKRLKREKKNN